jgi:hypothetical protein
MIFRSACFLTHTVCSLPRGATTAIDDDDLRAVNCAAMMAAAVVSGKVMIRGTEVTSRIHRSPSQWRWRVARASQFPKLQQLVPSKTAQAVDQARETAALHRVGATDAVI